MNQTNTFTKLYCLLATALLCGSPILAHEGEKHTAALEKVVLEPAAMEVQKKEIWGRNYFPNYILTTQDGEKLAFFDDVIKDKVVAINFIFTSCVDSCPLETARMKTVKNILGDRVGKDVFFYSITIDPITDSPPVLKAYMAKYGIDGDDWTFLTGDEADIVNLRKKLGLYAYELGVGDEDLSEHNLSLIIGNQATGRWMKRSPFEDPQVLATQIGDWLHNWKYANTTGINYANAQKLKKLNTGERIFRTRCSSCHTFGKDGVGPDLLGVTKARDPAWLKRWLKEPDKMLEEEDPLAISLLNQYKIPMPNMRLTERDINEIIQYMSEETERRLD